jgi:hypothetical protein
MIMWPDVFRPDSILFPSGTSESKSKILNKARIIMNNKNRILIRDIVHCKPGKVRPIVEMFLKIAKLCEQRGLARIRVLTDVSAQRFWTAVSEIEVESLDKYTALLNDPDVAPEMEKIMEGYHDFVDLGRREIYTIEG